MTLSRRRILLLMLMIGCTQPEKNDREAVQEIAMGIIEADNQGAIDRVVNYYSTDAVLMPPGKKEITGIDNIRKNYEQIFTTSEPKLHISIDEIKVGGNWAICYGKTQGAVIIKSDSAVKNVDDKYIMVLTKVESEWKIARLIWNSN